MIGCSRTHGVLVLGILLGSLFAPANARGEEDGVDSIMYQMPYFPPANIVKTLDEATKKLWLQALARPEQEMRCRGAGAFALAKQRGYKGLEMAIPPLRALIESKEQPPEVVLAACRALAILESRDAAGRMLELARSGSVDLCSLIEPSLAVSEAECIRLPAADWLDATQQDREPECSGHNAAWAVEMVMGVYHAALQGTRIPFPLSSRSHPLAL